MLVLPVVSNPAQRETRGGDAWAEAKAERELKRLKLDGALIPDVLSFAAQPAAIHVGQGTVHFKDDTVTGSVSSPEKGVTHEVLR